MRMHLNSYMRHKNVDKLYGKPLQERCLYFVHVTINTFSGSKTSKPLYNDDFDRCAFFLAKYFCFFQAIRNSAHRFGFQPSSLSLITSPTESSEISRISYNVTLWVLKVAPIRINFNIKTILFLFNHLILIENTVIQLFFIEESEFDKYNCRILSSMLKLRFSNFDWLNNCSQKCT